MPKSISAKSKTNLILAFHQEFRNRYPTLKLKKSMFEKYTAKKSRNYIKLNQNTFTVQEYCIKSSSPILCLVVLVSLLLQRKKQRVRESLSHKLRFLRVSTEWFDKTYFSHQYFLHLIPRYNQKNSLTMQESQVGNFAHWHLGHKLVMMLISE